MGVTEGEGFGTKNDLIGKVAFARVFGNFVGKFSKGNSKVRWKSCGRDFEGNEPHFSVPLSWDVFQKEKQRAPLATVRPVSHQAAGWWLCLLPLLSWTRRAS